jgi:hypothetical protein
MQSRIMSWVETCTNVGTGYLLALFTQQMIFPWFDIHVTVGETSVIAAIFTAISVVRGYLFRRLFNWIHYRRRKWDT